MRVLLVEDDDHVASALSAVLTRHGFEVVQARSGEEALRALMPDAGPPVDVVLLDLGLPDQDGYEVCGRIRRGSGTPVIMVTARADVRSRIHGLNLGADDYVVKPYDTGELLARIHAVSRRRAGEEREPEALSAGAAEAEREPVRFGTVLIEPASRRVEVDGRAGDAHPQGVRPAGPAGAAAGRGLPARADHQRGVAHQLGGHRAHPGGPRGVAARQARPAGADRDGARSRLPARRPGRLTGGRALRSRLLPLLLVLMAAVLLALGCRWPPATPRPSSSG